MNRFLLIMVGLVLAFVLITNCTNAQSITARLDKSKMKNGKATKIKSTFSIYYHVSIEINAKPKKIWSILTDGSKYTTWNSTYIKFDGNIKQGEEVTIKVKIAPDRQFTLEVSELIPEKKMVWQDGTPGIAKGVRTYTLTKSDGNSTKFTMQEIFQGAMLPMFASSLPDMTKAFEQFALDLKTQSEK